MPSNLSRPGPHDALDGRRADGMEAAELAFQTVHDDLLHHGELRGVEVKLTEMMGKNLDASTIQLTAELGVSDGEAMLTYDDFFTVDV